MRNSFRKSTLAVGSLVLALASGAVLADLLGQTISFGTAPRILVGSAGTVSAVASSSLPVTFSSNTPGVCSVSGSTITGLMAGTCTIAADQAGDGTYAPAPQATQDITVTTDAATVADLSIVLSLAEPPSSQKTGRDEVYTFTVTNGGPGTTTGVTLDYDFTAQATYIWATPGCTAGVANVSCPLGSLASGASVQVKIVVRAVSTGLMMSAAHVSGTVAESSYANNRSLPQTNITAPHAALPILRYRLFSPVTKEHHYTTDENEYLTLGTFVGTWVQEGTVGKVLDNPGSFNGVDAVPYYRLYNTATQWHHWTTDPNEYYTLIQYSNWSAEGVDGFILPTTTAGATQLYRLNYPYLPGLHHWTIDQNEYDTLVNAYGWIGEGGTGFVIQ